MAWCPIHSILFLFLIILYTPVLASPYGIAATPRTATPASPVVTPAPIVDVDRVIALGKRQDQKHFKTCGYHDGDPESPWIAPRGFNCRIDTADGLWGFCPSSVSAASDCGLHGYCFDRHDCTSGCGSDDFRTLKCGGDEEYCFTALWVFANDVSYTYVGCATASDGRTIFPTPTTDPLARITDSFKTASLPEETEADTSEPPGEDEADTSSASEEADTEPKDDDKDSGGSPNNIGAIVGGVLGGIALICISAVAAIYIMRRNRNGKDTGEGEYPAEPTVPTYYTYDATPTQKIPVELDSSGKVSELHGQGIRLNTTRHSKMPELPG